MSKETLLKTCPLCQQQFPNTAEHFYRRPSSRASSPRTKVDLLRPICKACHQAQQNSYRKTVCIHCGVSLKGTQRRKHCSTRCKVLHALGGVGAVYGRLTILDYVKKSGDSYARCMCACGKEREVWTALLKNGQTQSCGCLHRDSMRERGMEKHPLWKGGRTVHSQGYVLLKKPGHPNAQPRGYVLEHVFVMSEFLGRPLRKDETVHHRNGVKADNRLENLELWSSNHGRGQRVEDVLAWCKAYIAQYEADVEKLQTLATED